MYETLVALVDGFSRQPVTAARALRELQDDRRGNFVDHALRALRELPESPESTHLLRLVMDDARILERIADPNFLSAADAIQLARRMQAVDPATEVRLLRLLQTGAGPATPDPWRATRILEILDAVSSGARIHTVLPALLRHSDPRVRSKAALLIGRVNQNLHWLEQRLADSDSRVRANAIESMWGVDSPEARELFLAAASDRHYRVAANAIVGLHRAGDLISARIVRAMARHADPQFRSAAAWAMGETGDPRFLPVLACTPDESQGAVRRNVLRATVRIRKRIAVLREQPPFRVTVHLSGHQLEAHVRRRGITLDQLPPTAFVVTNGNECVEMVSVQQRGRYYEIVLAEPPVPELRLAVYGSGCTDAPVSISRD
jgi:hypothetical protein